MLLHKRRLLSRAQPSLRLLIFLGKLCGCTPTAFGGRRGDTTAYLLKTKDCLLPWDERLCAWNALPEISTRSPYWPLCERVNEACSAAGRVTTCVLPVGSQHNHVDWLILICGADTMLELVWEAPLVSERIRGPLLATFGKLPHKSKY